MRIHEAKSILFKFVNEIRECFRISKEDGIEAGFTIYKTDTQYISGKIQRGDPESVCIRDVFVPYKYQPIGGFHTHPPETIPGASFIDLMNAIAMLQFTTIGAPSTRHVRLYLVKETKMVRRLRKELDKVANAYRIIDMHLEQPIPPDERKFWEGHRHDCVKAEAKIGEYIYNNQNALFGVVDIQ